MDAAGVVAGVAVVNGPGVEDGTALGVDDRDDEPMGGRVGSIEVVDAGGAEHELERVCDGPPMPLTPPPLSVSGRLV